MAAGAYSSIFIATPLAVQLKANEKEITQQDARARARARRDVDRYADVPLFTEDMPVRDEDADRPRSRGVRGRVSRRGTAVTSGGDRVGPGGAQTEEAVERLRLVAAYPAHAPAALQAWQVSRLGDERRARQRDSAS